MLRKRKRSSSPPSRPHAHCPPPPAPRCPGEGADQFAAEVLTHMSDTNTGQMGPACSYHSPRARGRASRSPGPHEDDAMSPWHEAPLRGAAAAAAPAAALGLGGGDDAAQQEESDGGGAAAAAVEVGGARPAAATGLHGAPAGQPQPSPGLPGVPAGAAAAATPSAGAGASAEGGGVGGGGGSGGAGAGGGPVGLELLGNLAELAAAEGGEEAAQARDPLELVDQVGGLSVVCRFVGWWAVGGWVGGVVGVYGSIEGEGGQAACVEPGRWVAGEQMFGCCCS